MYKAHRQATIAAGNGEYNRTRTRVNIHVRGNAKFWFVTVPFVSAYLWVFNVHPKLS